MRVCDECKGEMTQVQGPIEVSRRAPMSEAKVTNEFCSMRCVARWAGPTIDEQAAVMVDALRVPRERIVGSVGFPSSDGVPLLSTKTGPHVPSGIAAPAAWESIDAITKRPTPPDPMQVSPGAGPLYGHLLIALCVATAIAIATITIMENLR